MNYTERRTKLRKLLGGSQCLSPASVFDPLSARVAESVGFEIGMLAGSVVSSTLLAVPDFVLHTLTECADLVRRITRASELCLFVDADHGFGNALNVMRTVQELEHAGVSALSIEDTALPIAFGQAAGQETQISLEEATGKMRAAVAARGDPSLVIVGRTSSLVLDGLEGALVRVKAYAAAGVDAIYLATVVAGTDVSGKPDIGDQIRALHAAAKVPLMLSLSKGSLTRDDLAARGVRLLSQGVLPVPAAVKALQETYTHLFKGGAPADLKSKIASPQEMDQLVGGARYKQWISEYLR